MLEIELRVLRPVAQHSVVSSVPRPCSPVLIPFKKLFQVFRLLLRKLKGRIRHNQAECAERTLHNRESLQHRSPYIQTPVQSEGDTDHCVQCPGVSTSRGEASAPGLPVSLLVREEKERPGATCFPPFLESKSGQKRNREFPSSSNWHWELKGLSRLGLCSCWKIAGDRH